MHWIESRTEYQFAVTTAHSGARRREHGAVAVMRDCGKRVVEFLGSEIKHNSPNDAVDDA